MTLILYLEMIANYSAEIKIAIIQSISECQGDEWRYRQTPAELPQKLRVLTA